MEVSVCVKCIMKQENSKNNMELVKKQSFSSINFYGEISFDFGASTKEN